jgi:hypothetical protein
MTNDPTTTGAEVGAHGTLTRGPRQGFKFELEVSFDVGIYAGSVWVGIFTGGAEPVQLIQVPLSRFESEVEAHIWAAETIALFEQNWRDTMGFEAARHFGNIGRWHLYAMGRAPYASIEDVIDAQVKQLEKSLREWFRLKVVRGHPSKWSPKQLADALLGILAAHPRELTWDELREELKTREPGRTPKTGNALRVLAGGFGLKLRELRRDAAKRRSPPPRRAKKSARARRNAG